MDDSGRQLHRLFPELDRVTRADWVQSVCSVWEEVLRRSKWETLTQAPFSVSTPGITLIGHTQAVLQNALKIAQNIREIHGSSAAIDMDILIVSCILHDVDKLLAIEPSDSGEYRYSELAKTYQHGFYSAYYAEHAGLPPSVVTLLISHTAISRMAFSSIEGMILFFADVADAELCGFIHHKPSSLLHAIGKTIGR